jgi:hypothetical protein
MAITYTGPLAGVELISRSSGHGKPGTGCGTGSGCLLPLAVADAASARRASDPHSEARAANVLFAATSER